MEIDLLQILNKMVLDGIQWQEVIVLSVFFLSVSLTSLIVVSGIVKIFQTFFRCFDPIANTITQALTRSRSTK